MMMKKMCKVAPQMNKMMDSSSSDDGFGMAMQSEAPQKMGRRAMALKSKAPEMMSKAMPS